VRPEFDHCPNADRLVAEAEEAEAERDFALAYRKFMLAADVFEDEYARVGRDTHPQDTDDAPRDAKDARPPGKEGAQLRDAMQKALFMAGLSLERDQEFRAHAATWRRLADSIGQEISDELGLGHRFRRLIQPGQSRMFSVISHKQWDDPYVGYYEHDPVGLARHQQAWAYSWAANGLEVHGHYMSAARANRLSAICWELSCVGELGTLRAYRPEDGRTEAEIWGGPGGKWRLALIRYTRAAVASALSRDPAERAWLHEAGDPKILGWDPGAGPRCQLKAILRRLVALSAS
jgi:hypothetical protein